MKIAYLSTFYPFRGGIAQFNAALYREFENSNHDIKAYTFTRQYPQLLFPGTSQYVNENDIADRIDSFPLLDTINPFSYYYAAKEIINYKPDLLITKFWMPFFGPSLGTVLKKIKKHGTKCISILDNVIPHEKRFADIAFIKYFLNHNNGFIVMSDTVKNDLLTLKPEAKYCFLNHPLYNHFGKRLDSKHARGILNIDASKKVLLFFGFIRDYKGLDLLIDAMAQLNDEYLLLIAGESYGDFSKYNEQIKKLNLNDQVKLEVRYINDEEVTAFFSASDLCILPYKSATQSGILGITYHFNVPVIATDVGSLREAIEPFGTGTIVEKPNSTLLASAIKKYFDENLADDKISNILKLKEIWSWRNFASGIEELYKKL